MEEIVWPWSKILTEDIKFTETDLTAPDKAKQPELHVKFQTILAVMCAFLNVPKVTGKIVLPFDESARKLLSSEEGSKVRDNLLKKIEQKASSAFGSKAFVNHFNVDNANTTDQVVFSFKGHTDEDSSCLSCTLGFAFALKTHFYWPSTTQVMDELIIDSPSDIFEEMAFSESEDEPTDNVGVENLFIEMPKFTLNQKPHGLRENDKTQFKCLNDSKVNSTSLADRIVNKSNKLSPTISSFANKKGGSILCGIDDKSYKVTGQKVTAKEREKIEKKINSTLSKILWPEKTKQKMESEKGERPWGIEFIPVKDEVGRDIPDTYVIVITVKRCPGGVFVEEPESYYIVDGKVARMPFTVWKARLFAYWQALKALKSRRTSQLEPSKHTCS